MAWLKSVWTWMKDQWAKFRSEPFTDWITGRDKDSTK